MIRCRAARRYVQSALDRALSLEQRLQLDEHTAHCSRCAREEQQAARLQEWLEAPADPGPGHPDVDAAVRAVFSALEQDGPQSVPPWEVAGRRRKRILPIAAGVLLVGAVVVWRAGAPGLDRTETSPRSPGVVAEPTMADGSDGSRDDSHDVSPDASIGELLGAAAPSGSEWDASRVELAVRAALIEVFSDEGVPPDSGKADAATARFLELTSEPARAGWPVRRFVEALLAHPDLAVARRAAFCLGGLGDAVSAAALERALSRAELDAAVLAALARIGEPAVPALERALERRELSHAALGALCRVGGARAALAIERRIRASSQSSDPSRAALLDALTATGAPAVGGLLRVAAEARREERDAVLARLPLVEGARDELGRCLPKERDPSGLDADVFFAALALLQPRAGIAWLEERCGERKERALALAALSQYADLDALGATVRLASGGRVPREDVLLLLGRLLERDAERAERFTLTLAASGDPLATGVWLDLLLDAELPRAAPSLVRLAFCDLLPDDDRVWAALMAGELGRAQDGELLLSLFLANETRERRLSAACVLAIHRLSGEPGVERALADASPQQVSRVLVALDEAGTAGAPGTPGTNGAMLLHRVARSLDGALSEIESARRNRKEIL